MPKTTRLPPKTYNLPLADLENELLKLKTVPVELDQDGKEGSEKTERVSEKSDEVVQISVRLPHRLARNRLLIFVPNTDQRHHISRVKASAVPRVCLLLKPLQPGAESRS